MARLEWDKIGERLYETGTEKGVLYPVNSSGAYPTGVAWNGLTGFSESPDGGDATDIWADDIKYLSIRARENFKATITAYTYPDEFAECDGSAAPMTGVTIGQQPRKGFGFSCVTKLGNDTEFEEHGYKLHLVWGATASPSSKDYKTINDSPEAIEFSWEIDTIPVNVTGYKPTAHMVIDSTKFKTTAAAEKLAALEDVLYGSSSTVYVATQDATKQTGKTYYTRSGSSAPHTYTEFTGSAFVDGTTYYEATTAGPRLPMPDEVIDILT